MSSDLIIYSNLLDIYIKNINLLSDGLGLRVPKKQELPFSVLAFHIFKEDLNKITGKKIEKLVNDLDKKKINFKLDPLPYCLFGNQYPKNIKKHIFLDGLMSNRTFLEADAIQPIYNGSDFKKIPQTFNLWSECSQCKFRAQKKCNGIYTCNGSYICQSHIKDWLQNSSNLPKGGSLLDCGCGANPPFLQFYKEISQKQRKIYLLDPSGECLKALKEATLKYAKNITLIQDTIEKMRCKKGLFDMIILTDSYSHLQNLDRSLLNIRCNLKKKGLLLIRDVWEQKSPEESKEKKSGLFHFRNHHLKQATLVLEKHGFKIVDSYDDKVGTMQVWAIKARKE